MWAGIPKKRLPRFMGLGDPNQHNESSRGDSIMSTSDDPYSKLKQSRDRARIAITTLENSPSHTLTGDVCLHLVRVFYTGQSVPVDMNKAMRFAEQAALHYLRLCGENLACTVSKTKLITALNYIACICASTGDGQKAVNYWRSAVAMGDHRSALNITKYVNNHIRHA